MADRGDWSLLARYCPVLIFHPDENYFPTSVEHFLKTAELHELDQEVKAKRSRFKPPDRTRIAGAGELDPQTLVAKAQGIPAKHLQLLVDGENRHGAKGEDLDGVPIYGHRKRILDEHGNVEAIELNYMFFYAYNGPYVLTGLVERGAHVGDWEHVTVRCHPDGALQAIYYNSHRNIDGDWVDADKVPRSEADGRPLVYVAKHGHGCYPKPGTQVRLFFLANDECGNGRDGGVVWRPKTVVMLSRFGEMNVQSRGCELPLPETMRMARDLTATRTTVDVLDDDHPWTDFHGYWGTSGNPTSHNWFQGAEHPVSRGWFKRLCCHCLPGN